MLTSSKLPKSQTWGKICRDKNKIFQNAWLL